MNAAAEPPSWAEQALTDIARIRGSEPSLSSRPKPIKPAGWTQVRSALLRLGAVSMELTWLTPRGKQQVYRYGGTAGDLESYYHRRFSLGGRTQGHPWSAGWVDVWLAAPMARSQAVAMRAVIGAFIDRLLAAHNAIVAERAVSAVTRVEKLARENPPGTVIARATTAAILAMRGHHGAYLSLDGHCAFLEYFQRSRWRPATPADFSINPPALALEKELADALAFGAMDFSDERGVLHEALRTSGLDEPAAVRYAIAPVPADEQPVGAIVVAIDERTPTLPQVQKPALDAVVNLLSTQATAIYQRRFGKLIVDPVFVKRNIPTRDDLAFVLMPFTEDWSDRVWERVLRPLLEAQGLIAMRADDMFGRDVMEDIWQGLLAARVVIADISKRNPNVFYELGSRTHSGRR